MYQEKATDLCNVIKSRSKLTACSLTFNKNALRVDYLVVSVKSNSV